MMLRKVFAALALICPAVAQASWHRAETTHYVIYSQAGDVALKSAAERLEKYDFLLRTVFELQTPPSPIKVQVYMLSDMDAVAKSMPFPSEGVAGYYDASVRAPYAVTLDQDGGDAFLSAQEVLFHELTHHFMFQNFPGVYPTWYVEGFADFMGSTRINKGNSFTLGRPIDDRTASMFFLANDWITTDKLLTAQNYGDVNDVLMLYSEGWALVHYLWFNKPRDGQLKKYLADIRKGKTYREAAADAFGNLAKLNTELRAYTRTTALPTMTMAFKQIDTGPVDIRPVSPAQNALMLDDLSFNAGVAATNLDDFVKRVRRDAAPYGDDPFALRLVVEADRLAHASDDEAKRVAQWVKVAPRDPLAHLHVGLVEMDALKKAGDTKDVAWDKARAHLIDALRIDPNNAEALKAYYDSYLLQGVAASPGAQNGLFKALDLVPQDSEVRYELAKDFESRGFTDDAINMIRPAALQLASEADKSPKERARREKQRAKYRLAGQVDHETPREMYDRLVKKTGTDTAKP